MTKPSSVDTIATIVRGAPLPWPFGDDPAAAEAWLEAVHEQGMLPLVATRLETTGAALGWPSTIRAALARDLRRAVIVEEVQRTELVGVLDALAVGCVRALVFKGTSLAYTHYPRPWLRPRTDTDLLIGERDVATVRGLLEARGYARSPLVDGSLVMGQAEYVREDPSGVRHAIDVHWQLGNPRILADLLSFEELWARAVGVAPLGQAARTPCAEHALLVAGVHRVAHHGSLPRLIWLYDLHLLAGAMATDSLASFARLAVRARVARVCAHELTAARAAFDTRLAIESGALDAIFTGADPDEPSARYLPPAQRRAERLLVDLRLLPGWRDRARLVGQHLFPSPAYMRVAYGRSGRAVLPVLYAHRILTGVWGWFRRTPEI